MRSVHCANERISSNTYFNSALEHENGTPECYKITFEDGHSVTCSDAHEFLIDGNWVEAKDLDIGYDCQTVA